MKIDSLLSWKYFSKTGEKLFLLNMPSQSKTDLFKSGILWVGEKTRSIPTICAAIY
jgi:hypothetical protein